MRVWQVVPCGSDDGKNGGSESALRLWRIEPIRPTISLVMIALPRSIRMDGQPFLFGECLAYEEGVKEGVEGTGEHGHGGEDGQRLEVTLPSG